MNRMPSVLLSLVLVAGAMDCNLLKSRSVAYEPQFNLWLTEYKPGFTSLNEYTYRLQVFSNNLRMIERHNARQASYTMGLNQFAHLTFKEFSDAYLSKPWSIKKTELKIDNKENTNRLLGVKLKRVDWTEAGKVTPVANQGKCGGCYAFASVASVESYHAIHKDPKKPPPLLSKQHMIDCGRIEYGLRGCQGGNPEGAFAFIKDHGVVLESDYPYRAQIGLCHKNLPIFTTIKGFENIKPGAGHLIEGVEKRPVMIGIEFQISLMFYKSGIYQTFAPCGFFKNHTVLAVGYDLNDDIPHLIIKNSYGVTWGDNGYLKFAIGKLESTGMCLFADGDAYAPEL